MKKTLLAMAVAGVAVMGMMNVANAADGTINFTGEITDVACTIDTGSKNLNVDLGKVARTALDGAAGTKASPTKFTLKLTSCPATVTAASVKFDGTSDTNNTNLLQITQGTGVATGVGIEIADKNGVAIPLHAASADYPLVAGDNSLEFVGRYVSTLATVTTGPANGVSQFTLNYK